MDSNAAANDLKYIRNTILRASHRIDPHLFHAVHWGVLVLVTYPMLTWLFAADQNTAAAWVGIGGAALGVLLSAVGEFRLRGKSRVRAANTHIETQVGMIFVGTIVPAVILSALLGERLGPPAPRAWRVF